MPGEHAKWRGMKKETERRDTAQRRERQMERESEAQRGIEAEARTLVASLACLEDVRMALGEKLRSCGVPSCACSRERYRMFKCLPHSRHLVALVRSLFLLCALVKESVSLRGYYPRLQEKEVSLCHIHSG